VAHWRSRIKKLEQRLEATEEPPMTPAELCDWLNYMMSYDGYDADHLRASARVRQLVATWRNRRDAARQSQPLPPEHN